MSDRQQLARLAAPAALLLGVTVLVLLVRSAMSADEPVSAPTVATTVAPPATTAPPAATTAAPETTAPPATTGEEEPTATYTIQSGDTFQTIADDYGTTVEQLLALNPAVDPTALQIGQQIRVP